MANFNGILSCGNNNLAKNGVNDDITSLTGLTTALPISEGGTGAKTAPNARTNLGLGAAAVENLGGNVVDDGAGNLTAVIPPTGSPGDERNGLMSKPTSGAAGTFTADTIIVGTALNGVYYLLPSFSHNINLALTGAGGMDTGSAPASGFLCLYAIYKPSTSTAAMLAQDGASGCPTIYGGANMPAGYTASGLVGIWPTTAGSVFAVGIIQDRSFSFASTLVLNAGTAAAYATFSLAAVVPVSAVKASGSLAASSVSNDSGRIFLASSGTGTAAGVGETAVDTHPAGATSAFARAPFSDMKLITAQTLSYYTSGSGTVQGFVYINGYSW